MEGDSGDSANGLAAAEIAKREETDIHTIYATWKTCGKRRKVRQEKYLDFYCPFLDSFLTPSHSIWKTIGRFSTVPPLGSLALA
jgi:hypothetical protein